MDETELEYVGFWARFGAFVIDSLLVMVILVPVLGWLLGAAGLHSPQAAGDLSDLLEQMSAHPTQSLLTSTFSASPADFLLNWVFPAIAIVLFWIYRQATPGKMAIGARIVDAKTGGPLSTRQSIVRYLGYFVATIPFFLGLLWVAFDPRKQGWHDKLAGTVVVRPKHRGTAAVSFEGRR